MKTVMVNPKSELGKALEHADDERVVLVHEGVRYRVAREKQDPFANYDPAAVQAAFDRVFGILKGVDVEKLIAELKEERSQDSVGRPA